MDANRIYDSLVKGLRDRGAQLFPDMFFRLSAAAYYEVFQRDSTRKALADTGIFPLSLKKMESQIETKGLSEEGDPCPLRTPKNYCLTLSSPTAIKCIGSMFEEADKASTEKSYHSDYLSEETGSTQLALNTAVVSPESTVWGAIEGINRRLDSVCARMEALERQVESIGNKRASRARITTACTGDDVRQSIELKEQERKREEEDTRLRGKKRAITAKEGTGGVEKRNKQLKNEASKKCKAEEKAEQQEAKRQKKKEQDALKKEKEALLAAEKAQKKEEQEIIKRRKDAIANARREHEQI